MPSKPKTQRWETTEAERRLIWNYHKDGRSYGWISERVKRDYSTIASLVQRMKKRPSEFRFINLSRSRAPRKLDVRAERALVRATIKNTKTPLAILGTPSKSGKALHKNTVRKYLKEYNKHRRRPRKKPYMKPVTRKKRVKWCKQWRSVDPMKICHSDKSSYKIGFDSNNYWVTRTPQEEMLERNLKPTFRSSRMYVSVWACFCGRELGPIVILEKGLKMTSKEYIDTVLKPHYVPFWRKMQRKYSTQNSPVYMQQDNHSVHTAGIVKKYLAQSKVKLLPWPPSSPDLAPIENLWIQDKRVIGKRRHYIRTKEQMGDAIIESWWNIDLDRLETLARSLPKRMDLCIKAKGGPIKY